MSTDSPGTIFMTEPAGPSGAAPASWGGGIFEIFFILIVFFCILFLAFVVTRFVAKRAGGRLRSRRMEVMDTLAIGADAQLLIIKAGAEYFLAAKSQKQLSLLTKLELSDADFAEEEERVPGFAGGFRSILEGKLSRSLPQTGGAGVFRGNIDKLKGYSESGESIKPAVSPGGDPVERQPYPNGNKNDE
jgi:flagellar protein FliO/FliZ